MQADLLFRGGRVVTHTGEFRGGLAVSDGRIVAIGADDALPSARREIDLDGRVLMPGVVDPHCHLGVNYDYDEDMRTETAGAASGGVTTVLLFIRNPEGSYIPFYKDRRARGEQQASIDFGFHFGIQREDHIPEIAQVAAETGVRSFKCHMGYERGNPIGIVSSTDAWVYGAMREAVKLPGGVVSVHCENTDMVELLKKEMMATGRQDLAAYTESRPTFVEEEAIGRMIKLAELTGCPLYIVHTSVGRGPELAAEARARGIDVTMETCPHYLLRTAYDEDLGPTAKISPPLRDLEQQAGLWRGMLNGSIDTLGTDHVPFIKTGGDLWSEKPGVVSFNWELPLMLHHAVHERGMSLSRLVQLNSYNPAKRFGLAPRKGTLAVGADADLVVVDLDEERTVTPTGKGTCLYDGWTLRGWPVMTVSRGRVVFENGEVDPDAVGHGQCVNRPESERS
ncbi:dihydroorotase [Nocardioides marmoribigeumensis]|uniref:Dihydroorotase (Multifunctional complex type) n=1 Tax=Nocardioides marmoribigeumensis TaxID=433649 RepID=A0ABU2BWG8_9ACTN|nr:amidohydrolase family protein [Nocardioides marmoribigeumensis]MDR7362429.1 dihydroorotase (multifunctional complex type) [Nocardioides marmoribigeumensis]